MTENISIDNSSWKDIIEAILVERYAERLYNMSFSDVMLEAEKTNYDVSELFQKNS